MAITNAMIIATEAQRLLEEGKLQPTGRILTFETREGDIIKIPEAEPIHTFAMWKQLGFKVKKGEHAITRLVIWKYASRRAETEEPDEEQVENGHCFRKEACFFATSQVEPMNPAMLKQPA